MPLSLTFIYCSVHRVLGKCNSTTIDSCLFEIRRFRLGAWINTACVFLLLTSHSHSHPLLAIPFSTCLLATVMLSQLLIMPSTKPPRGYKHVYTGSCVPLYNSARCGISGDWHVLCPFHLFKKCDSWATLFPLLLYEDDVSKWDIAKQSEEWQRDSGSHQLAWRKGNVGTCVMS